MSNLRARTAWLSLDGNRWYGPLFTEEVAKLHDAFVAFGGYIDPKALDAVAGTPGLCPFPRRYQVRTDDGYLWLWHTKFMATGGCVAILLPFCDDRLLEDGTSTDRSCAAYFTGNLTFCDVDDVVRTFRLNFPEPPPIPAADVDIGSFLEGG
jgi:hypothetical protein